MILALLACAGSALVLTQSNIAAPIRDRLTSLAEAADVAARARRELGAAGRLDRPAVALARLLTKLVSCPMCAGFWLGLAWATMLGSRGMELAALGFAGSLASALLVALWLALSEVHTALSLWRYLKTPPKGIHLLRVDLAMRRQMAPEAIACPEPGCEATGGNRCRMDIPS